MIFRMVRNVFTPEFPDPNELVDAMEAVGWAQPDGSGQDDTPICPPVGQRRVTAALKAACVTPGAFVDLHIRLLRSTGDVVLTTAQSLAADGEATAVLYAEFTAQEGDQLALMAHAQNLGEQLCNLLPGTFISVD